MVKPGLPHIPIFDELPEEFLSARAKFEWAKTHIPRLNDAIKSFDNLSPWRPSQEPDFDEGYVRISISKQPPEEFGLIIGDIVHSLRASLDYAVGALFKIAQSKIDPKRIYFPFGKEGKPLNNKESAFLQCIEDEALLLIEHARVAGGHYLHVLNRASNQDKHRLILASMLRQLPVKFEFDQEAKIGDFVIDREKVDIWTKEIKDGDVIKMDGPLTLRPGFYIEGDASPYNVKVVDHMVVATFDALVMLIECGIMMKASRTV